MPTSPLIASIAHQEFTLVFDAFDEHTAWLIGNHLRERGVAMNAPIIVDIRFFHRPLFFCALPGTTPDNLEWARRKRNVVERFQRSSYRVGREMAAKNDTLSNRYGLPLADYAEHGGGFPITLRGTGVIGAIIVSGLAQREDHMLIVEALCEALRIDPQTLPLDEN